LRPSNSVKPFRIFVSDDVLHDPRVRLARTLFTTPSDSVYWATGTDPDYLRELVAYWGDDFDWRGAEAALNAHPQFVAEVGGRPVHFVHVRGRRAEGAPAPLPLILSHGWPSSFVEMLPLVGRLTDPARYGGDPADAFDVVIPSPRLVTGYGRKAGLSDDCLTRSGPTFGCESLRRKSATAEAISSGAWRCRRWVAPGMSASVHRAKR
jgi:hypothetical protein